MAIKSSAIAGTLATLFALTTLPMSVQSKGGCPAPLGDPRFAAVAQLNNGTLSGQLGRGVRGRKVTGLGPSGDKEVLLVVAATWPPAYPQAFVIPFDFSTSTILPSVVSFPLPISVPPGTDYSRVEIGSINGDSLPDVVVASAAAQTAWVFLGSLNGIGELVYSSTPLILTPPVGVSTSRFGAALACGNLQSSSPTDEIAISDNISGRVFIFELNESGFTPTVLASPVSGDGFGKSLAIADVTGSTHQDLIVGANNRSKGSISGAGAVIVYPGPNFTGPLSPLTLTVSNAKRNHSLGQGVTGGDVHGVTSSFPDVIASTWSDARAQVFTGLVTDGQNAPLVGSLTDVTLTPAPGYEGGWSTTGLQASDINDDGRIDVFVGAPNASVCGQQPSAGAIHIFLSGPNIQPERVAIQSAGGIQSNWLAFGWSVSPVPGTSLFVVGEPGREFNGTQKGQVYVYRYQALGDSGLRMEWD